jgi:type I restriction enzyme M protein
LFLQLIMRKLLRPGHGSAKGGRAGVVVSNGTLSGSGVAARVKQDLVDAFNLHTVVRLPNGVFTPYTPIPTNVLFFDRSGPTAEVWYYEHPLPQDRKNYTKTKPLQFEEFNPLFRWWADREENDHAWIVPISTLRDNGYNLDLKNPRAPARLEHLPPTDLVASIMAKEGRIAELIDGIRGLLRADRER